MNIIYTKYLSLIFIVPVLFVSIPLVQAQGAPQETEVRPGVRFNGLGRAYIQQADLGGALMETDTTTAGTLSDGEFILDLAVNAMPNRTTEVQGVLRLRNEFGGFFGSGVTVEVRELWARGIIADAIEYRVGDMDLALTPYTVFSPSGDGRINTPEVFEPQQEIITYEEFYTDANERRLQGGRVDFGLAFDQGIDAVDARAFLTRLRPTDFTTTPTRFLGGGRVGVLSAPIGPIQAQAGVNLVSIWDDLGTGDVEEGIRNHVVTVDADVSVLERDGLAISLLGEGGRSIAKQAVGEEAEPASGAQPRLRETDTFVEAGFRAHLKPQALELSAMLVDVGPDFFSAAAQSKRVDYTRPQGLFDRIGNERDLREVGLFDLTRDPAVHTYRVSDRLTAYDPRYNNTLPYGRATPNRRGVRFSAAFVPSEGPVSAEMLVALLREIRGQGTEELKDFALVRTAADVSLAPLVGYRRGLTLSLGAQAETTNRGGEPVEQVDLTSLLVELGLTAEVYDRLDMLFGLKARTSSGRDYVPEIAAFNDVDDFPAPFVTDDREGLLGTGLRYRFGEDIYLTLQYQHYRTGDDATPEEDYTLSQVFALYTMNF